MTTEIDRGRFLSLDLEKYEIGEFLGKGAYGIVIKAVDKLHRKDVAIKHISKIAQSAHGTSKIIRELFLLNSLQHSNILSLIDVSMVEKDLYVVTDFYEFDLHKITYANVKGTKSKASIIRKRSDYLYVLYQILDAVQYIHSIGVLHRDIKPANILVGLNLHIKLCDFGFARLVDNSGVYLADDEKLTEYVVTRWYRAPEVFLNPGRYGKAQDIWAVACSFCELFRRYPLFPGQNTVDQVQLVVNMMGTIKEDDFNFEMTPRGRRFLSRLKPSGEGLRATIGTAGEIHPKLLLLLLEMLQFNPNKRITAENAMKQKIFNRCRKEVVDEEIEEVCWDDYHAYLSSVSPNMSYFQLIQCVQKLTDDIALDIQSRDIGSHFEKIVADLDGEDNDDTKSISSRVSNTSKTSRKSAFSVINAVPDGLNQDGFPIISHEQNMTHSLSTFAGFTNNLTFNRFLRPAIINPEKIMWIKKYAQKGKDSIKNTGCPDLTKQHEESGHLSPSSKSESIIETRSDPRRIRSISSLFERAKSAFKWHGWTSESITNSQHKIPQSNSHPNSVIHNHNESHDHVSKRGSGSHDQDSKQFVDKSRSVDFSISISATIKSARSVLSSARVQPQTSPSQSFSSKPDHRSSGNTSTGNSSNSSPYNGVGVASHGENQSGRGLLSIEVNDDNNVDDDMKKNKKLSVKTSICSEQAVNALKGHDHE